MINTKNVKDPESTGGSGIGLKPILSPGNHFVAIRGVELRKDKNWEKYGDKLILRLETSPVQGFKGLPIDKTKPELGNYQGQIGFVAYSRWGFADFTAPDGTTYTRIESLLVAIKTLCKELGILEWFDKADDKYPTIEDFVIGFNVDAPYKDIFFHVAIYGREYMNGTYINHDLYLPKFDRVLGKPFCLNKEKVITFYESTGIDRLKSKTESVTNQSHMVETKTETKSVPVDQPVRPKPSSQAEADFMNAGKTSTKEERDREFLASLERDEPTADPSQDIITDSNVTEKLPWEQ